MSKMGDSKEPAVTPQSEELQVKKEGIQFKKLFEDDEIEEGSDYLQLAEEKAFLKGEFVLERIGITDKTLTTLAESGEFALGRVGGAKVVIADTLYAYLDRCHFRKRRSPDEPVAIDSRGNIKKNLTYVDEKHTSVPKLRPFKDFAKDLGLEERTFLRHCEIGTFTHYRIGSLYKMTEEDYTAALRVVAEEGMKSNRGNRKKIKKKLDGREVAYRRMELRYESLKK